METLELQIDGCYVDNKGVQHYTFPREILDFEISLEELALAEYHWHLNPDWQGQYTGESDEVEADSEAVFDIADSDFVSGRSKNLFPRETFLEYVGDDHDALAYCEYQWYKSQI